MCENQLLFKSEALYYTGVQLIAVPNCHRNYVYNTGEKLMDTVSKNELTTAENADNEDQFAGCMSLNSSKNADEWIRICTLRKDEKTCGEVGTTVPSHTFLAIRKRDNRIIGVIDLRHHIDHPILGTWGGHCGYSVRPSERRKGYAKEMLRLDMLKAKELGINKMLVTCDEGNDASEKTILANGGVYEKTIDVDGDNMKRFWISI